MKLTATEPPSLAYTLPSASRWTQRFEQHLDQVPMLLEVLRGARGGVHAARTGSERVSGGGGVAPSPLRETPVDDADDLWAALVEYTGEVAERLQDPAPAAVGATWAIDESVRGLPSWMNSELAYTAGFVIVSWLIERGVDIASLRMNDAEEFLFSLIRKLQSRYVLDPIERPAHARTCSVCGERAVVVSWVSDETGEASCRVCGATYAPEDEDGASRG
jgi:hypothetical protein